MSSYPSKSAASAFRPQGLPLGFGRDDDDDENDSLLSGGIDSGRVTPLEPSAKPESSKGHRWKTSSAHPDMVKGPWTTEVSAAADADSRICSA